jgi:hypothetical protein
MDLSSSIRIDNPIYSEAENELTKMKKYWPHALEAAKIFSDKTHLTNKTLYDKSAHKHAFKVNDIVYTKRHVIKDKLSVIYDGPFRIIEMLSANMVLLKPIPRGKNKKVHTDDLKFFPDAELTA